MRRSIRKLLRDNRAVTAVEYALVALLIAVGMIAGLMNLRSGVMETWSDVDNKVAAAH